MPGKRFWPPTKHKLLYANIILYVLIILLLLLFHRELIWAQKTMRGYLFTGQLDPPYSNILLLKALQHSDFGEDAEVRHRLLKEAYQIDPYSLALLLLGDYYKNHGQEDLALSSYNQFLVIDPSFTEVYVKMAEILRERKDHEAVMKLIEKGIIHFNQRVTFYQPRYNVSVPKEFNHKASKIYTSAKEGLERLEKIKEELNDSL
jgi:tetratricopeptide (TPR) repeat protein